MPPLEMLTLATKAAAEAARREGTTVTKGKADTAEAVLARIASGDIPLTGSEMLTLVDRMNRVSGTADRSVAVYMLEAIIGVGIRRAA